MYAKYLRVFWVKVLVMMQYEALVQFVERGGEVRVVDVEDLEWAMEEAA